MANFKVVKVEQVDPHKPYQESLVDTDATGPGNPGDIPVLNAQGVIDASLLPAGAAPLFGGWFFV